MQTRIRRDRSRLHFGKRRHGSDPRILFAFGLLIGGFLVFVYLNFGHLQLQALDAVGMAPTATPRASDLASQGMALYQDGQLRGALEYFERTVALEPHDIDYLYEYGSLLLENEIYSEALPIAERAIEAAPDDPRGYALKARALMWSDPATAVQTSILGQDVDPNYAPLYAASGVAYTNLGRWNEGIRNGLRAVELDPTDPFVRLAYHHPLTYVGRFRDAIESLEAAVSINPNNPTPYFYLAALYKLPQVGEPEMAVATYNHIIQMQPDNAKAYLRLCETYAAVELARFDVAQPYCDRAIEIDETYAQAYRQRGRMQYQRRNYEGAIESFEQCELYGGTEIECWYLRGLAYYWLAECDNAWNYLEQSKEMARELGTPDSIVAQIDVGLGNVTVNCAGYSNRPTPTAVPPTVIPPTPIGGFGG
jgi:tetratricopeptide (TPR) repeat protein